MNEAVMAFYDFFLGNKPITLLGERWMKQAADYTLQRLLQVLAPLERVVEIGPGLGALTLACRERGLAYAAIDANIGLLHQLKPANGVCSFVPPIPVRDAACDAVVARHLFEHSAGLLQAQALLSEMFRIVRPGGCVVIISPDLLWVGKYFWDCDYSHNFPTSSRRLHQMFLDHGLEVVHLGYVHNHLNGWRGYLIGQIVRLIPYRILSAQSTSTLYIDRIYKSRLTFARSVMIIGRRPKCPPC